MIPRDKYLGQLIMGMGNGFPKIVTGIRRCGKSYLLKEIFKSHLISLGVKEEQFLLVELDDDANANLRNPLTLSAFVREKAKGMQGTLYVVLDEIQRVFEIVNPELTGGRIVLAKKGDAQTISFVDVVMGLASVANIDLYVTGSNSRMLSSDIVTQFRDKATRIHVAPLSFSEYYAHVGGAKSEALYEYLLHGGMPLAVLKERSEKEEYQKGSTKRLISRTSWSIMGSKRIGRWTNWPTPCPLWSGRSSPPRKSQTLSAAQAKQSWIRRRRGVTSIPSSTPSSFRKPPAMT